VGFGPRLAFVGAGPVAAYLIVACIAACAIAWGGEPAADETSMRVRVIAGGPAFVAGMRDGDRVLSVGGMGVADWQALRELVAEHADEAVPIVVERDDEQRTFTVVPTGTPPRIQIVPPIDRASMSLGHAAKRGLKWPAIIHVRRARAFARLLRGSDEPSAVGGPVGLVSELSPPSPGERLLFAASLCSYFLWIPFLLALALFPRSPRPR
jgi:membrane-associated protease RseP (regulator of RpoE activity)